MTDIQPAPKLTQHLAETVARLREQQRLPYTELSERLAKLGQPIPVLGLRRIEHGERRVDVDELAALAKALGVPPVLLVLPVGAAERTEILPEVVRDTWDAAKWFTGEAPLSTEPEYDSQGVFQGYTQSSADFNAWHTGARSLDLFREHERLLMQWRLETLHTMSDLLAARAATDDEQSRRLRQLADEGVTTARGLEKALIDQRRFMQQQGLVLPDVPELHPDRRKALAEVGLTQPDSDGPPWGPSESIRLGPVRSPGDPGGQRAGQ